MVNPYGPKLLWFPIHITSDRFVMDRVTEFLSPNFHDALPFKYMLLALIGALSAIAVGAQSNRLFARGLAVLYVALFCTARVALCNYSGASATENSFGNCKQNA